MTEEEIKELKEQIRKELVDEIRLSLAGGVELLDSLAFRAGIEEKLTPRSQSLVRQHARATTLAMFAPVAAVLVFFGWNAMGNVEERAQRYAKDQVDKDLKEKSEDVKLTYAGVLKLAGSAELLAGSAGKLNAEAEKANTAAQEANTAAQEAGKEATAANAAATAAKSEAERLLDQARLASAGSKKQGETTNQILKEAEKLRVKVNALTEALDKGGLATEVAARLKGLTGVPIGTVVAWPASFGEDLKRQGWLLCDGKPYPRALYPTLYERILDRYGDEGQMKFRVPDYRGYFLRGTDDRQPQDEGRVDPDAPREVGAEQADAIHDHRHWVSSRADYGGGVTTFVVGTQSGQKQDVHTSGVLSETGGQFRTEVGTETRPVNRAVHWIIYAGSPQTQVEPSGPSVGGEGGK